MADAMDEPGHGDSPAAWTAVVIMLVAVSVGTVALFFDVIPVVLISAAFIPIGLVVGGLMKRAGYGVGGHRGGGGSH